MTTFLWSFVAIALVGITLIALLNALTFMRLGAQQPQRQPAISILVPARDEAALIGETIGRLLRQDYPNYEVLLLDDQSSDETAEVASQVAAGDQRFQILKGAALPANWLGKNWACSQLAEQAQGEWLVFCDADVSWEPRALTALVGAMQAQQADVFTIWPTQIVHTWAERLVVPLMMFAVLGYLPEVGVRRLPFASMSAANGQCLIFTRAAYRHLGGHAVVRAQIIEDVALARRAKRLGLRLGMALGSRLVTCRMYTGWEDVRRGFGKNILAGYGGQPVILLLATVYHWLLFIAPWVWLASGSMIDMGNGWPWMPLLLVVLGISTRILTDAVSAQRPSDALLMPISVLLMTLVAAQSFAWHFRGGPEWKGRKART